MEQLDLSAAQSRGEESTRTRAHILIESARGFAFVALHELMHPR